MEIGDCAAVVRRTGDERLADLDARAIADAFRARGLVLFRGFGAGPGEFDALAGRFTTTHFFGYGRAPFPEHKAITSVNETQLPLEPHSDNGIRKEEMQPEITWFHCQAPADRDGETTVFDGIRVLDALRTRTRALLEDIRIRFVLRYDEAVWSKMGFSEPEAFGRFIENVGGHAITRGDRAVEVEIISPAIRRTKLGGEPAFMSSLCLAGSAGFESMRVTLEGGDEIPRFVELDVRAALDACCALVRWEAGDVAMLDNTRFLHGRRAFEDRRRRIYLIQTLRARL